MEFRQGRILIFDDNKSVLDVQTLGNLTTYGRILSKLTSASLINIHKFFL